MSRVHKLLPRLSRLEGRRVRDDEHGQMGHESVFREDAAGELLGFGTYEQSIKVGKGSGVISAFYDIDQIQEIDFEPTPSGPSPNHRRPVA